MIWMSTRSTAITASISWAASTVWRNRTIRRTGLTGVRIRWRRRTTIVSHAKTICFPNRSTSHNVLHQSSSRALTRGRTSYMKCKVRTLLSCTLTWTKVRRKTSNSENSNMFKWAKIFKEKKLYLIPASNLRSPASSTVQSKDPAITCI